MVYIYFWIAAQIILEMLPISSSGHLLLLQQFLMRHYDIDFSKRMSPYRSLYYILHGITFFIVLFYFGNQWLAIFYKDSSIHWQPIWWLIIADLVTCCFYIFFKKFNLSFSLGLGFLITAVMLISTRYCHHDYSLEHWQLLHAAILGTAQGMALLPGISRLASTTAVGCFLGYSLSYSFLLSWLILAPLMASAAAKDLILFLKTANHTQLLNTRTVLTILVSSIISWYALEVVDYAVNSNAFFLFGPYMCIPLLCWVALFW